MKLLALAAGFALALAASRALNAQSPPFDVASVKPNVSGANGGTIDRSGGRIRLENTSLREIISFAVGIATGRDYELSGPGWRYTYKFDILATCPPDTPRGRVQEMLQRLLVERFALKTHTENRKLQSYALVVDKQGPKLHANTTGAEGAIIWGTNQLTARAISMKDLANRMSGPDFKLDRPVVDMTDIPGDFDFTLNWVPETIGPDGHSSPSIFTALREQLGLRLENRKIAFTILIVDHVNRVPTDN